MGKKKYVRRATPGGPIDKSEAPPNLAARIRGYESMSSGRGKVKGNFDSAAFHRPGSMKK